MTAAGHVDYVGRASISRTSPTPRRSNLLRCGAPKGSEMAIRDCDELGAALIESGRQWNCNLQPAVALRLLEHIRLDRKRDRKKIERALDKEMIADEDERRGYKMALGIVYHNRAKERKENLNIPFAPR